VISRLEAALSLAMIVMLVCFIGGWETAARIAGVPFSALLVVFVARVIYRKSQGRTWDEAWGRPPADR
jgi:TRAP-type C4-dicarboxylate transport system permease large subunit